jgi:hypothetical protein
MTDPEHDDVFEAYLQRRSVLPALDDELEPPVEVDEAVLTQARQAIQPATKAPAQRPPRWAVPVALAATVLLCLSVVMNISLNSNRPSPNRERMAEARADLKAGALANATAESNTAAGVDARVAGAARDRFAAKGERPESIPGDIASREVVLPQAKVAGVAAPRTPVEVESSAGGNSSAGDAASPAVPAPPPPPAFASAGSGARNAPASGETGVQQDAADAKADSLVPHQPRVPAADKAVLLAKRAGVAAPEYTPAPEAARTAGQAVAKVPDAAKALNSATATAPHPADPKVWLKQIDALRAAGKADLANAQMRRFKAAFPEYAIPAAPAAGADLPK